MIQIRRRRPEGQDAPTAFVPGELVRHRRYGYRGVVVDLDSACTAPEGWYEANKTQPRRDQPWYHVLVDGSVHTTYAAEDSLMPDYSVEEISHPLLERFFEGFTGGYYRRNDRPWGI